MRSKKQSYGLSDLIFNRLFWMAARKQVRWLSEGDLLTFQEIGIMEGHDQIARLKACRFLAKVYADLIFAVLFIKKKYERRLFERSSKHTF
jgi:hypothetical protein